MDPHHITERGKNNLIRFNRDTKSDDDNIKRRISNIERRNRFEQNVLFLVKFAIETTSFTGSNAKDSKKRESLCMPGNHNYFNKHDRRLIRFCSFTITP